MCLLTDHAITLCLRVLGFRRQSTPNLDFACIVSIGTKSRVGVEFDPRATFWYVWPILVVCYSDKALCQFVVDAILRWRSDKMTHDFPVILPFLALLRASHARTRNRTCRRPAVHHPERLSQTEDQFTFIDGV
jgi:hypothetical protein